jgi:hypothetical protein
MLAISTKMPIVRFVATTTRKEIHKAIVTSNLALAITAARS